MKVMWVRSMCWEDPMEEEIAIHSSNLAWKNPMDRGTWRATWGRKELDTTKQLSVHLHSDNKT